MTKQEAIDAMLNGSKITHPYFQEWEYIYMESGKVFYESGSEARSFWEVRDHHRWHINWELYRKPVVELIGGKILSASDLEAMNAAEIKSRKIPIQKICN